LSAIKRKKNSIDIFEITFKNLEILVFTVEKHQYDDLLKNCLEDLVKAEEYELCAEVVKMQKKRTKKLKIVEEAKQV
jgi:hypothetical protein